MSSLIMWYSLKYLLPPLLVPAQLSLCQLHQPSWYLGHVITDTDDEDIFRQCRMLYVQANVLRRKFGSCADEVKLTAHLWSNYNKVSFQTLKVVYSDSVRILVQNSLTARVNTLQSVFRTMMFKFISRLNASVSGRTDIVPHAARHSSGSTGLSVF